MNWLEVGKYAHDHNLALAGIVKAGSIDEQRETGIFWNSAMLGFSTLIPHGTQVFAGITGERMPFARAFSMTPRIYYPPQSSGQIDSPEPILLPGLPYIMLGEKPSDPIDVPSGLDIRGKQISIVTYSITTGSDVVAQIKGLWERGARVKGVMCFIESSGNGRPAIETLVNPNTDQRVWMHTYLRADQVKVFGQLK